MKFSAITIFLFLAPAATDAKGGRIGKEPKRKKGEQQKKKQCNKDTPSTW
jgi:hypothetical protein